MANIHVLEQQGNAYRFAFHVAVPVGNNSSGIAWATAYVNHAKLSSGAAPASLLPTGDGTAGTISAAELAAIAAGTTLEVVYTWPTDAAFEGLSGANQQALVDAVYSQVTTAQLNILAQQLRRFGLMLT